MIYTFNGHKYRIYHNDTTIIAVSTFMSKAVRGIAKCSPNDEFNIDVGLNLACARCARKIEKKRTASIQKRFNEANRLRNHYQFEMEKAACALKQAEANHKELEKYIGEFN